VTQGGSRPRPAKAWSDLFRAGCPILLTALLAGCAVSPDSTPLSDARPEAPGELALEAPRAEEIWPISTRYYRTTSAEIYLGNLDARVATLERRVQAGHRDRAEALASQLYHRYKLRGRLQDADRATALLAEHAAQGWLSPGGMVLYAIALSGLHRFDEADQWLQRAREAGAKPEEWRDVAADILVARGDYRALATDIEASAEPTADFYALAHRADLRLLQGDLAGAERHYLAAQALYRDSSPVPLAWLHTQMGIGYLRFGRIEDARRFFAAAVERLPGYYLAEEHLAECETQLGQFDAARERYLQVIEQTGNPEFSAALAGLEREAGNLQRAEQLVAEAKQGYEALLARLPGAYAQHAAEFYIETGDAKRAYTLARKNAELRSDVGSMILLANAAHAAGEIEAACKARKAALAPGFAPPEVAELEPLEPECVTLQKAEQEKDASKAS
jgi:hypothetical protein